MSPRSSGKRGPFRKPRADVYTLMLAIALVAIIVGCICLYLEVADYGSPPFQLGLSAPLHVIQPVVAAAPGCGPCPADCSTST